MNLLWKNSKPNYSYDESEKAEMLEVYTRWLKGEKLSRKQKRLLKAIQEYPELEPLKQLVDFAHYRFRETESVIPRPGAKQRVANELMQRIRRISAGDLSLREDGLEWQPAYSPEGVGSDSELAYSPVSTDVPPPQPVEPLASGDDPFGETIILDGESGEGVESPASLMEPAIPPLMDSSYNLKLKVVQGEEVGREYNIAFPQIIIGQSSAKRSPMVSPLESIPSDLPRSIGGGDAAPYNTLATHATAAPQHARIRCDGDDIYITDLGSGNGTAVDGVQISGPTPLRVASKITIGTQSLEVAEIQRDTEFLRMSFKEIEGTNVGQVHSIHIKEMTVGRGKAARLRFADSTGTLSRVHARFDVKKGEVYVTDLGSANGTYVDGTRIEKPTRLTKGTTVQFGSVSCEVVDIEGAS
ncbi:FHA domain-containing protein [Candidatus Poribacteria bacterium]|nr:FHA domain-containing protein [Candidatus Poribacteria bacterium]